MFSCFIIVKKEKQQTSFHLRIQKWLKFLVWLKIVISILLLSYLWRDTRRQNVGIWTFNSSPSTKLHRNVRRLSLVSICLANESLTLLIDSTYKITIISKSRYPVWLCGLKNEDKVPCLKAQHTHKVTNAGLEPKTIFV